MGYFHQMVVNNVGKMISGKTIRGFIENLIVKNRRVYDNFAANHVVNMNIFAALDFKTHHVLRTLVNEFFHFLGRKRKRVAH